MDHIVMDGDDPRLDWTGLDGIDLEWTGGTLDIK